MLVAYARNTSGTQIVFNCQRLADQELGSIVPLGVDFTGTSIVLETVYELAPRDPEHPMTVTFDGRDAAEFDPAADAGRVHQQFNLTDWTWTVEDVSGDGTDVGFAFASVNGSVRLVFATNNAGTLGTTGDATSDMLVMRLVIEQAQLVVRWMAQDRGRGSGGAGKGARKGKGRGRGRGGDREGERAGEGVRGGGAGHEWDHGSGVARRTWTRALWSSGPKPRSQSASTRVDRFVRLSLTRSRRSSAWSGRHRARR